MAILRVIKGIEGWNIGDLIEASGNRLEELLVQGVVEIVEPDPEPVREVKEEVDEEVVSVKRGRPRKW